MPRPTTTARLVALLGVLVAAVCTAAGPASAFVPYNDDFANAQVLTEPVVLNESDLTEGATAQPGEPAHGGRPAAATVWYRWTAPADLVVTSWSTLTMLDSKKRPSLALAFYTGASLRTLKEVASDAGTDPVVTFDATAGTDYKIALNVRHRNAAEGNTHLFLHASPPNDNLGSASAIGGTAGSAPGYVMTATRQQHEPQHSLFTAYGGSVWYDWTAPTTGFSRFGIECCAGNQPALAVYTGSSLKDLHAVSSGFNCRVGAFNACTSFRHVRGTTYHIAVQGDGTSFPLRWAQVASDCSLEGTAGDDILVGTSGADYICGHGGDDVVTGLGGDDVVVGGRGIDVVDYAGAPNAVEADLSRAAAFGAGADTLQSVEGVVGSRFDDTLTGDPAGNRFQGGDGRDRLEGHGGDDRLRGGAGVDVLVPGGGRDAVRGGAGADQVNYGTASAEMAVDLRAGVATGQGRDRLTDVEDVVGSAHRDHLVGNPSTNFLFGGSARDNLEGGAGDDALFGQDGADALDGGKGADACNGGPGSNTFSRCE
jgi:Ca2+-binding RTX toxin-like protein